MYEIFEMLCDKKGITPYKFCKDTGTRTSTISTWKKKKSLAGSKLAQKICDYFGVTMDYLMNGIEIIEYNEANITAEENFDLSERLDNIIFDINNIEENPLYYKGEKIDEKSLAILEQALMSAMKQVEIMREKDKK